MAKVATGAGKLAGRGLKSLPGLASKAGSGLATAAGALEGAGNKVKSQGLKQTATAGLANAAGKAGGKVASGLKSKGQAMADNAKTAYGKGYDAAGQALQNHAPTAADKLNDPSLDLGGHTGADGNQTARHANTTPGATQGINSVQSRQHRGDEATTGPVSAAGTPSGGTSSVTGGGSGLGDTTPTPPNDAGPATGLGGSQADYESVTPGAVDDGASPLADSSPLGDESTSTATDPADPRRFQATAAGGSATSGLGANPSTTARPATAGHGLSTPTASQPASWSNGSSNGGARPVTRNANPAPAARPVSVPPAPQAVTTPVSQPRPTQTVGGQPSGPASRATNAAPQASPVVNRPAPEAITTVPPQRTAGSQPTLPPRPTPMPSGRRPTTVAQDFRVAKQSFSQAKNQLQQGLQYINQGTNRPPHK